MNVNNRVNLATSQPFSSFISKLPASNNASFPVMNKLSTNSSLTNISNSVLNLPPISKETSSPTTYSTSKDLLNMGMIGAVAVAVEPPVAIFLLATTAATAIIDHNTKRLDNSDANKIWTDDKPTNDVFPAYDTGQKKPPIEIPHALPGTNLDNNEISFPQQFPEDKSLYDLLNNTLEPPSTSSDIDTSAYLSSGESKQAPITVGGKRLRTYRNAPKIDLLHDFYHDPEKIKSITEQRIGKYGSLYEMEFLTGRGMRPKPKPKQFEFQLKIPNTGNPVDGIDTAKKVVDQEKGVLTNISVPLEYITNDSGFNTSLKGFNSIIRPPAGHLDVTDDILDILAAAAESNFAKEMNRSSKQKFLPDDIAIGSTKPGSQGKIINSKKELTKILKEGSIDKVFITFRPTGW